MSVQPVVNDTLDALERAGVGSTFTKTVNGWDVKWVDGGTCLFVQGATVTDALGSHGAQVIHPDVHAPRSVVIVPNEEAAPDVFAEDDE